MVGDTATPTNTPASIPVDAPEPGAFLRWAGWSGLVGTISFIVTIVMTTGGVTSPDGPGEMTRYLADVTADGWLQYVYGVAGAVLVVLYIPMAAGLHRLLGRTTASWHGTAAVVFGLAVLLPAYLINVLPAFSFASLAGELGTAGSEALYADYAVARAAAELFFTVGSVLSLAVGPLLWGAAWLRSSTPGRWIGWAGVITGVTGVVWFVWLVENPLFGAVLIVNVLMSLVFFTGASVTLVTQGRARH